MSLNDYRGKIVLLGFWRLVPPCIAEMPSLIELQKKMKDKDVVILGVSIDEDEAAYHKFLKNYGVNFVTVMDKDRKTPTIYGTFGWPETYIIRTVKVWYGGNSLERRSGLRQRLKPS